MDHASASQAELPLVPRDKGDRKGQEFSRAPGEALIRTLRHTHDKIASDGGTVNSDECLFVYAVASGVPAVARHKEKNARRFLRGCDVTFEEVKFISAQG